jgi:PAS domain S-box-containing protein
MMQFDRTVLIIDQSPIDRETYRRYLAQETDLTYTIWEAESAAVALELCSRQLPDGLLLNYELQDMNGLDLLVKFQHRFSHCPPVVMVTDHEDVTIAVKALKTGADDYLATSTLKPDALRLAMRSAIETAELRRQSQRHPEQFRVCDHTHCQDACNYNGQVLDHEMGQAPSRMRMSIDLPQQTRTEDALRQSEDVARQQLDEIEAIYANAPIGLCYVSTDLRFVRINQYLAEINGLPVSEHIGRTLREILPEMAGDLEPLYHQVMDSGESLLNLQVHGINQAKPGIERDWIVSLHPLKNSDGMVLGVNAMVEEITERIQIQARLTQSEERYRSLAELIPQLVWTADVNGTLLDVNQRWLDFTGFTLEQIQVVGWQVLIHPEDLPLMSEAWAIAQHEGSNYQAEGRLRRADGTYHWYLHQATALKNDQGQIIKWFGTGTNIEEQKQLEQQRDRWLQEAQASQQEAEAANRSKDEFIAIVAHELRSPLNSVMGWTRMLQTRTFDPGTTAKALDTIARNTQAQIQLIDDLLDISRMIHRSINLKLLPIKLEQGIEAALELMRPMAAAKQIQLETRIQAVASILGDINRLQQIIINLLTNAIKFTPVGGRVEVGLDTIDGYARLQVCDTGKGIASEFLPYIFERFHQAQTHSGSKDGLGLGLAIVKHLVEQHNGTVTAASPGVGQGATFTVLLPLLTNSSVKELQELQSSTSNSSSQPLSPSLTGLRILIVDDEPDNLEMLRFALEEFGGVIQSATTATDAINLLAQFQPDLLISDIAMPEMNGYELLQKVRQCERGQVPAIAITAYASFVDREKSLQAGFQEHFRKPVEPEALVAAILKLLSKDGD